MALVKPYYTKISELHKDSKIPYIKDFVTKNAEKFYDRAQNHSNNIITPLGQYKTVPLPFRVKHRLPRPIN